MVENIKNFKDFTKAKIYCIRNNENDELYIGASCQSLSKRMAFQRNSAKTQQYPLYKQMRQIGIDKFYIELIECFPCKNWDELKQREGYYIRERGTLNKRIENRTKQEWIIDNIDKVKKQKAIYYDKNKELVKQRASANYYDNKEERLEYQRKYKEANKEKIAIRGYNYRVANKESINDHAYEKIICDCGSITMRQNKLRHERTMKHQEYLKSLENQDD